ncbi:amino acid ABC transporter permease [Aquabacterium sp.]|uniref:amino acid ABC transporter permease n=1 Tax=Aquabacterium sp. TaxID=1872578 RepID=UPI0040383491
MDEGALELRWFLLGGWPKGILGGLALNVSIAFGAFAGSFLIGHVLALGRMSREKWLRWPSVAYIELVRSVPLLIVLFWFYFSLPILLGTSPSPALSALIALTAYASAYQAEIIRAGITGISRGQIEAARSLGLSRMATLMQVVLAQSHRKMLPTYASYFTSLFKDSSALYILGLVELMQAGLILSERRPDQMLRVYLVVGSLFFIVCFSASQMGRYLEHRFSPRAAATRSRYARPAQPVSITP